MMSIEMRTLATLAAIGALAAAVAAGCGDDDGGGAVVSSGPTTITIEKTFARDDGGEFTFTVRIANNGDDAAVQIALSDVWQDGIEVTSIGDLDGIAAKAIGSAGFEVLLDELNAGESQEIVYKGSCASSGQWTNTATVSSANADPATTSVSISCP